MLVLLKLKILLCNLHPKIFAKTKLEPTMREWMLPGGVETGVQLDDLGHGYYAFCVMTLVRQQDHEEEDVRNQPL